VDDDAMPGTKSARPGVLPDNTTKPLDPALEDCGPCVPDCCQSVCLNRARSGPLINAPPDVYLVSFLRL
jgi:hypothetical protein